MHLEYCIENGKFDELIHHVKNIDPDSATETNVFSQTPLHLLCSQSIRNENENVSDEKLIEVVRTLLDAYPDALTDIDEQRRTPLHCACLARPLQPSIIAFLLAHEDDNKHVTERSDCKEDLDSRDFYPFCAPLEHMHMRQVRAANTPLHLLCQSSLWSRTDYDDETLFRVLKLILTAQPWTCLTRNRVGVSPIYLMFGWKYNNRNNPVQRRQSLNNDGQGFLFFSEEEQQDKEWKRRWKAVLYMIRYVAIYHREGRYSYLDCTMKDLLMNILQEDECSDDDSMEDDFLYLHATLHVDRTCPVWDTILHYYGHQVSMLGTCHGMKCHKGGGEGDYPLAIAATQCNFSSTKIANQFITSLCELYPEAARHPVQFCGCGGTVLEHAIQNHLHFDYSSSTNNSNNACDNDNHYIGGALGSILLAYPDALRIPEQVYGFYPFMLSATLPTEEGKQRCKYFTKVFSSKLTKWSIPREESNILNTTYTLLRMAPDLLAHFLS